MTLKELIEKLQSENTYESIGSSTVFEAWIDDSINRGWDTYGNCTALYGVFTLYHLSPKKKRTHL